MVACHIWLHPPDTSSTAHDRSSAAQARIGAGTGHCEVVAGPGQYSQRANPVAAATTACAIDGTVIAFADDAAKWSDGSRWVRAVRPDQQGRYQIQGLPPGDYLAVAVDYVEDGAWNEPEYLDSIRRHGQRLTLSEAESKSLTLKPVTP